MGICSICQCESAVIAGELGVCLDCIRREPSQAQDLSLAAHSRLREEWGLPGRAPRAVDGAACDLCVNRCRIGAGGRGYCGLRGNMNGAIDGVTATRGKLTWYHDPLPTNCVGNWVCPGGSDCGFPEYSYSRGAEYGYQNLAVFPHACTFHCLYCQNWHFRYNTFANTARTVEDLVAAVNRTTACICYFGGDPSPQLPYLLNASRKARARNKDRILRICWETNGAMSRALLEKAAETAMVSGGCIKIDLKAWDETLHIALTGVTNRQTLENFQWLAGQVPTRQEPPLLIASTLMVPGYIDADEIKKIASFVADLGPDIPYNLLAFHPAYKMTDLKATPRHQAEQCLEAARQAGLTNVHVGNRHLLW